MAIAQINWQQLSQEEFLKNYWQKKPLLIKKAFDRFTDPVEPEELAGFAMEEFIESRIITNKDGWQVNHGPFEDFSEYGDSNWTLLVQATNHWSNSTQALLKSFKFIPNWRIDDVMVSFSTPQGGVGRHLDQYDVFIIQGLGKRHWQVGLPDDTLTEFCPTDDLKQVSEFEPIIDVITEPGDLLYIPPNHPHNGYALENSLNYSIGFQAPNGKELLASLADYVIDNNLAEQRLTDADRQLADKPYCLDEADIVRLKNQLIMQIDAPEILNQFLGKYLTQSHHQLNIWTPENELSPEQVKYIISEHDIAPVDGIKKLMLSSPEPYLFINGEGFAIDEETTKLAELLAQESIVTKETLKSFSPSLKNLQLLTSVLNMGFFNLVE
jgi:50S ribosomal protein L16 3-hydroxylase